MKLSTRSRYGLRAMYEIACNYKQGPVSIKTISKNQNISTKYLHSLLTILRSEGLVQSISGTKGGFVLARPPSKINLYDIVSTLEGSISIVDCVENENLCDRTIDCITRDIWTDINKAIKKVLTSTTLSELVNKNKKKKK